MPAAWHRVASDPVLRFEIRTRLDGANGRTGIIRTPHGDIQTPAFVPVGTKATVKAVLPESMADLGAQALLANAYHLYLQPGPDLVDAAGGLGRFMNWPGPTFTGFKKTLAMDVSGLKRDDVVARGRERMAAVDEDGVTFKSFRDGSVHRFTPEVSMDIQHRMGADIVFAFDELTTLMNTRRYQEESLERTSAAGPSPIWERWTSMATACAGPSRSSGWARSCGG